MTHGVMKWKVNNRRSEILFWSEFCCCCLISDRYSDACGILHELWSEKQRIRGIFIIWKLIKSKGRRHFDFGSITQKKCQILSLSRKFELPALYSKQPFKFSAQWRNLPPLFVNKIKVKIRSEIKPLLYMVNLYFKHLQVFSDFINSNSIRGRP